MREDDIRPKDLLNEYLRLSAEDARQLVAAGAHMVTRPCPACGRSDESVAFTKNGFRLIRCPECDSLYAKDCLDEDGLAALYADSPSARFWATRFLPAVQEARRAAIFQPRALQVRDLLSAHGPVPDRLVDVGAGNGIFLEEYRKIASDTAILAIEPGHDAAAACRARGAQVFEGFASQAADDPEWNGKAAAAVSFEVIEHVAEPAAFLAQMGALVRPGGLVLATGLCGTGFDILVLGEAAKAVSPPHHINFLSRAGVEHLCRRAGLELVAFLTPGKLDVDIVRNGLQEDPGRVADPFLNRLLTGEDEAARAAFQAFLAERGLSSHMWVLARRPGHAR